MTHNTLNIPFNLFIKNYDTYFVEFNRNSCLIRKDRKIDLCQQVRDFSRVYIKAKDKADVHYQSCVRPIWDTIKSMDNGEGVYLDVETDSNDSKNWKRYFFHNDEYIGHSYSYEWISEPSDKQNTELGNRFVECDKKQNIYNIRTHILKELFASVLTDLVYSKFDRRWIKENQFSDPDKIVKVVVDGHSYWFKMETNEHGAAMWECVVWQDSGVETIEV